MSGQRIVIVRCEEINISGSFYRNKRKLVLNVTGYAVYKINVATSLNYS
jgi:ribosomal protein L13